MIKNERKKLLAKMILYLDSIATDTLQQEHRCIRCRVKTERAGIVEVSAYFPDDHRDSLWIACRLLDWSHGVTYGHSWRGWRHWKQNFHPGNIDSAETMMEHVRQHFNQFGVIVAESTVAV